MRRDGDEDEMNDQSKVFFKLLQEEKRSYVQVAKMVPRYLLLWNFFRSSACMG
jgi:hypothetical protein